MKKEKSWHSRSFVREMICILHMLGSGRNLQVRDKSLSLLSYKGHAFYMFDRLPKFKIDVVVTKWDYLKTYAIVYGRLFARKIV